MGYKKGGAIGDVQGLVQDIEQITQVPGAVEMLMTMAAEELGGPKGGQTKQLRLYEMGGPVGYDNGGLAQAAQTTQGGGRGDDSMMLHLSPEEYEAITSMWGEPDINPNTGIPEYGFLSKLWKGIKKTVKKIVKSPLFSFIAPLALNFFVPGAGAALGGWLGAGKSAALVGNTLIRAGAGALGGGKEGALAGAVSGLTTGGVGAKLGAKLGLSGTAARLAGDALIGGTGSTLAGGDFAQGALGQAMTSLIQPGLEKSVEKGLGTIFPRGGEFDVTPQPEGMGLLPGAPQMSPSPSPGLTVFGDPQQPGLLSRVGSWIGENPMLAAAGAGMVAQGMSGPAAGGAGPPQLPPEFTEGIPAYDFSREQQPLAPPADYFTYGQAGSTQPGEHQFFAGNVLPGPAGEGAGQPLPGLGGPGGLPAGVNLQQLMARYGAMGGRQFQSGGYARGAGSGRDDTIEALLSDGEYVMDAETVALLGDGSNDAGAKRLDEMREELRKHKGRNLSKGKFSHDAKDPIKYLKKGGYAGGGKVGSLKKLAEKLWTAMSEEVPKDVKKYRDQMNAIDQKATDAAYEVWNAGEGMKEFVEELDRIGQREFYKHSKGMMPGGVEMEANLPGGSMYEPPKKKARGGYAGGGKVRKLRGLARLMEKIYFEELPDKELQAVRKEMNRMQSGSADKVLDAINRGESAAATITIAKARGGRMRERMKDRSLVDAMATDLLGE